jgi:hypothetical protein
MKCKFFFPYCNSYVHHHEGDGDTDKRVAHNRRVTINTRMNFTVIVNPDTGPGSAALPTQDYITQIQKLNTYPNVQTVGYVRTNWTNRNIDDVLRDVGVYSGWAANSTDLAVHGIFFDETPNEFSQSAVDYLRTINIAVKGAAGLLGNRTVNMSPPA